MKFFTKSGPSGWLAVLTLSAVMASGISRLQAQHYTVPMCGTSSTNTYGPMYSLSTANSTNRTAVIYPASQLSTIAGKTITSLYFQRATASGIMAGTPNFKIYLKEVSATDWGSGSLNWATAITGATLVYDANPAPIVGSLAGWKEFPASTNFSYSGTQNLAVLMEYKNPTASTSISWGYEFTSPCVNTSNSNTTKYTNNTTGTLPATLSTGEYRRPFIAFDTLMPACAGAVIAPTLSAPLVQNVCPGVIPPNIITATGGSLTTSDGLSLQWEESDDNGVSDPWASAIGGFGATTASYTAPAFVDTIYYRLRVTCAASGSSVTTGSSAVFATSVPTTQASAIAFAGSVNPTTGTISFTAGNGNRRYIVINTTNSFANLANGTTGPSTANTTYSGSGAQVVYDGTGTSVTVHNLNCNTTYFVRVFEYNRCNSAAPFEYFYNTTTGTTNPASFTTGQPTTATFPVLNGFTGLTGTNLSTLYPGWYEASIDQATGSTPTHVNPIATTSSWTNSTDLSSPTARLNLSTGTKNEWIISPRINLTGTTAPRIVFNAAITNAAAGTADPDGMQGTDDSVHVLVSTDGCGKVWTSIHAFYAANTTSLTNILTEFSFPLTSYVGQTIQVAFQGTEGPTDDGPSYDFHIDSVRVEESPSCLPPSSPSLGTVTNNSAVISWTASASAPAGGYQYYVSTSSTTPAAGQTPTGTVGAGALTATATGLSTTTTYYAWVRSNCGSGNGTSAWVAVPSFITLCNPFPAPFSEGFAGAALPSCWTNSNPANNTSANALWRFSGTPDYGTTNNGRTPGTFTWIDASTPYVTDVTLMSPLINLGGLTAPYLQFEWYKNNEDAAPVPQVNNNLKVEGNPGTGWVTLFNDTSNAAQWRIVGIQLPAAFIGTNAQFRFVVDKTLSNDFYDNVLLDSVRVMETPTCIPPANIAVSGITSTGASLSWTAPVLSTPGSYEWEIRASGAPGSGSPAASGTVTAPTTTATASGLAPITTYNVYVRSVCGGASGSSQWTYAYSFTTLCAASTLPFAENFGSFPPTCWTRADGYLTANSVLTFAATNSWAADGYLNVGTTGAARINLSAAAKADWLITPSIDLGATSSNFILEFNMGIMASGSSVNTDTLGSDDTVAVVISYDNGTTWNIANAVRVWTAADDTVNGMRYYIPFTGSGLIKVGFYGSEGSVNDAPTNDVSFDSVRIVQCTLPTTATLGNDTTLCGTGISITLNAGAGSTGYLWSTGATTQTISVNTPGNYSVTVYNNSLGCTKSDTISVFTSIPPVVNLGADAPVCGNIASLQVDAGNTGASYVWMGDPSINTQTLDVALYLNDRDQNPGTGNPTVVVPVGVVVTNAFGCQGGDTIQLTMTFSPRVDAISVTNTDPVFTFAPVADSFATTYSYDFGDGSPVITTGTHAYGTNGTYTVRLIVTNSCASDTVTQTVTVASASVRDVALGQGALNLYPNPTTADATLEVSNGLKLRGVQVMSATGQLVMDRTLDGGTRTTLNTSVLAPGIYTLRVQLDKGVMVRKLEVLE